MGGQPGNVFWNRLRLVFFSMRASSVGWKHYMCRITVVADDTVRPPCGMYHKNTGHMLMRWLNVSIGNMRQFAQRC